MYLGRAEERPPLLHELPIHAVRSTLFYFAQSAKDRELIIGHTHLDLVGLDGVVGSDGDQFCRGDGIEEAVVRS